MNSCCFPREVLYPSQKPAERIYRVGDYFRVATYGGLSRLVQVAAEEFCLISPDGNRHSDPIRVKDSWHVTEGEMRRLTRFPYEHVPNVIPAREA